MVRRPWVQKDQTSGAWAASGWHGASCSAERRAQEPSGGAWAVQHACAAAAVPAPVPVAPQNAAATPNASPHARPPPLAP